MYKLCIFVVQLKTYNKMEIKERLYQIRNTYNDRILQTGTFDQLLIKMNLLPEKDTTYLLTPQIFDISKLTEISCVFLSEKNYINRTGIPDEVFLKKSNSDFTYSDIS